MLPARLAAFTFALSSLPAAAVTIDGRIEPGEWQGARHITDFRQTQPLTGDPTSQPVEAWVLATPEGLAVAFRVSQPASVTRTAQRVQRDFEESVDRVNLMVDFNGDGRSAYNFTLSSTDGINDAVITNESNFRKDWDGIWEHAVAQDAQGWTAELRVPWHTAPMHKAQGATRTIGLYLDRVFGSNGERVAWPVASFMRPRFVSEFAQVEVPAFSQSLLAITPYASALYDNVRKRSHFDAGADLFWKPSGQFQLTASLNPDFGQVESDDLVINFSATETYFSDKRPFFTENQSLFAFDLLDDNSALLYTRRVGAPADDGQGAGDIAAAIKFNGSLGTTSYGVLAADERDAAGRFFGAARLVHDFGEQSLGAMLTHVDRPWLDRRAEVLGVDHHWTPTPSWTVRSNLVGSEIVQAGASEHGLGATSRIDHEIGNGWRQQWALMHFDKRLEVNDFGYLARNDFDYLHWELRKRATELPSDSRYRSHDWQLRLDALDSDDAGLRLRRSLLLGRSSELRKGGSDELALRLSSAAWDDLLTRGHGALHLPPTFGFDFMSFRPRKGDWGLEWGLGLAGGGLAGYHRLGWSAKIEPTYFLSDAFRIETELKWTGTGDWLVWQRDNLIGSFRRRMLQLEAGFTWAIGPRQELRMKLQAIGLQAVLNHGYRVDPRGHAQPVNDAIEDFGVKNLGLQIRYRYELAPLSAIYVVYGRGGYEQLPLADTSTDLLARSLSLRQDDQILVKFAYRFD